MTAEACREWREQLGAYALGHLDADERAAVQAHIDGCADCRAEAEQLMATASLLPAADPERLGVPEQAPGSIARKVFARIDSERRVTRRGRWVRRAFALSGATAAVAAIALGAVLVLNSSDESGPPTEQVAFHHLRGDVHIDAGLTPRPWGTQIDLYVSGVPSGTVCHVWMRRHDGHRVLAGTFRYVAENHSYGVTLATAVDRSRAEELGVTAGRWNYVAKLPDES